MKMRDMNDSRDMSATSTIAAKLAEAASKEFFWGCELTKDEPSISWNFEEEEDDLDYLQHTLFLRHAILGKDVKNDEKQVIEIETKNFAGEIVKQPIVSLTGGRNDMCQLDLNFGHEIPVTFTLVEGSGPVYLSAQQVVEFPQEIEEDEYLTTTETETEPECSEEEIDEENGKARKRKAASGATKSKKKRGKLDSDILSNGDDDDEDESDDESDVDEVDMETSEDNDEDEDDDDNEDDDNEDDDEEEEEQEQPIMKPGKAKGKAKPTAAGAKKRQAAAKVKKAGKKGKAK